MIKEKLVCIGTITRSHGVQGGVIVKLDRDDAEKYSNKEWVFIEIDGGPVPFFVLNCSVKDSSTLILTLDGVKEEKKARKLSNYKLFVIASKEKKEKTTTLSPNENEDFIDYSIIDSKTGPLGVITSFLDYPGNPLFNVKTPAGDVLIPIHPDFLIKIDDRKKTILLDLPEGLAKLNA
jgi:16S rRNA processing protein RimM